MASPRAHNLHDAGAWGYLGRDGPLRLGEMLTLVSRDQPQGRVRVVAETAIEGRDDGALATVGERVTKQGDEGARRQVEMAEAFRDRPFGRRRACRPPGVVEPFRNRVDAASRRFELRHEPRETRTHGRTITGALFRRGPPGPPWALLSRTTPR